MKEFKKKLLIQNQKISYIYIEIKISIFISCS